MDAAPRIRLSRLHHPVTALGFGRRVGVWVQGCSLGCAGCLARDTWPSDGGAEVGVDALADRLARVVEAERLDGVTISGGEPFEQPIALAGLVAALRARLGSREGEVDVLVYSGLSERRLRREFPLVLDHLDALIPEPFVEARQSEHAWWGSGNQRIVALSALGRARYADPPTSKEAVIQVSVDDGRLWIIGVPRRGDLVDVARRASGAGIDLQGVSWRP